MPCSFRAPFDFINYEYCYIRVERKKKRCMFIFLRSKECEYVYGDKFPPIKIETGLQDNVEKISRTFERPIRGE